MKPFDYAAPETLDEALAMLGGTARPLAGGTDLLTLMKADLAAPQTLVSIARLLPRGVREDAGTVTIGAATTLADLEREPLLLQRFGALAQAAAAAASPPLRNMATLGGNLLQRPRCWYFRTSAIDCWLKGGERCPARDGENRQHALFASGPCVAVHPSDPAAALLAFDAKLRIASADGERTQSLQAFFREPDDDRRSETTLGEGELVLDVHLPSLPPGTRSVHLKAMDRQAFAFALVSVAAVLRLSDSGRVDHARIVLGGVAPVPMRAEAAERLLVGADASDSLLERAAQAAVAGANALAHNAYKIPLARALVRRALASLAH